MAATEPTEIDREAAEALAVLPAQRLGSLLRDRRKEAGRQARRAARVAGLEPRELKEIESGRTLPGVAVLGALLTYYGVEPGQFFPRRKPPVIAASVLTSDEVLRQFIDDVRKWRKAGGKEKLRFRQQDLVFLSEFLGNDPDEIERRLIALTGCTRAEARRIRKWMVAALVAVPLASPLATSVVTSAAAAAPAHSAIASHLMSKSSAHKLIWADEFTGRAGSSLDSTRWQAVTGGDGWGNNELEYYTARSANVSLDGAGHLAITARRETYTDRSGVTRDYTSARIQTKGLFQSKYGQIEARIKLPAGQGLWPAFWALGADGSWPASGEMDIMENLGSNPFTIFGSIHGPQAGVHDGYAIHATERSSVSLAAGFHVYGVDWSPNKIVFTLDGVPYATRTRADLSAGQKWVFNKPFYLVLNLAVGGTWPGSPSASTHFPATMLVDWVRVYT